MKLVGSGGSIGADNAFGLLNRSWHSERRHHPLLISNEDENTMLRALRAELHRSQRFVFSIAFISTGALAMLKQALLDFRGSGVIVTSTYLEFNSPEVFRELLGLENVDVYVHPSGRSGFHAKGYVFEQEHGTTAIVGSSNLTVNALLRNREWNLRISSLPDGDITHQISTAIDRQIASSQPLTSDWIDQYENDFVKRQGLRQVVVDGELPDDLLEQDVEIVPNAMQIEALEQIAAVREAGERRAVVISATGTGKTILAALDVRSAALGRVLFIAHREQILDKAMLEFKKVLRDTEPQEFGKFVGATRELDRRVVFATVQTLSRPEHLSSIDPGHFDYVLIDEVHRAGAESYLRVIEHLRPRFLLGLTATPERTDDFNVFELFDYNVPYEIRLQAALEADMLAPFHYYGVTDFTTADGRSVDDTSQLRTLVAEERVDHLLRMIDIYGHKGAVRGLMFCSRVDEANELSRLLNEREINGAQLRTQVLTGQHSMEERNVTIERLERGELDYILSVDIFNEGIDIPTVNQVVMLRQTQSSIVFTQQLGRGLRKAAGKDHLRVIDFIGNYKNNYLIPIALLGDSSLNKDVIRRKLIDVGDAGAVAGLSSISFDEIARSRVLASLARTSLNSMQNLKAAFNDLEQRLGAPPRLFDFARFDLADPVVIATKQGNYWEFKSRLGRVPTAPDDEQSPLLTYLAKELLNGKRPHELLLLQRLIHETEISRHEYARQLVAAGTTHDEATIDSVLRILDLSFFTMTERDAYGGEGVVEVRGGRIGLHPTFARLLRESAEFRAEVADVIDTGLYLARHEHDWSGALRRGQRYSRKDVCRLLNWVSNQQGTIFGYKVDTDSNTCPIFVTYHKADDVSDSTRYEDEFLDMSNMRWYTRSRRTMRSKEVQSITRGEIPLYLFAKKDDVEGNDFYYLGRATPHDAEQSAMPGERGGMLDVVFMRLELDMPVDHSLYHYLTTSPATAGA